MSIAPMLKLTLCGLLREKGDVIAALQRLGAVHLVALRAAGPLEPTDAATRRRADAAWAHLSASARQLRPWPASGPEAGPPEAEADLDHVVDAVLANKERLRLLGDRRDFLADRIAGLATFGDFDLPPLSELRGRRLWFYVLPIAKRRALEALDLPWAVVGRGQTELHVAVISETEPPADLLPVARTRTGSHRLTSLERELAETEIGIERAETERAELTRHRLALGVRLAGFADADDRRRAAAMTRDDDRIFALAGWVPEDAAGALRAYAEEAGLAIALAPPAEEDAPPTRLDLPDGAEGAGALTRFYMTPGYRSWDPSLIVFASFAAFFAMILADAGYAGLLALGLLAFGRRLGSGEARRRLARMLWAVIAVAAFYGVLAGSYFGLAPPPGSLAAALAVVDLQDFETMMAVSVGIGVAHISLANLQVAWRRSGGERIAKLGWVGVAVSGYLLWLVPEGPWLWTLAAGIVAVFLGSAAAGSATGPRAGSPAGLWLRRGLDGALGLTRLTTLFGDALSYMRLFALGLASGALAATFNRIAAQMIEEVPGGGVALALLVLVFGHAINLALGILSGVVHGLRLNFIEFFGWGLTEEGYPFKPLAERESAA